MEAREDIFMMRSDDLERYQIICKIFDNQINQQEAAEYLDLSDRQVRRIVKRVRLDGAHGIIHKLRGSIGCRRLETSLKTKALGLYKRYYHDFGPTLASEKLLERHRIKINDETLRLWLIKEGLWESKKLSKPKDRTWRARKDRLGEMIQMDGSHHDWLEGRGPKLVLMGYIDDATGHFFGEFFDYEGTVPAMESLKNYIHRHGLPRSIYLDKHSTYKINKTQTYKDWPFRDKEELTQFGRACKQLGVRLIHAHSPQAKGRIERVFETLQDRLVKELRLSGAKTCQEANKALWHYLDSFNQKFEIAAKKNGDLHRPLDKHIDLEDILSVQTAHVLRNDRTVIHGRGLYQVLVKTRAQKVTVHEYTSGRMAIKHGADPLAYQPINARPKKEKVLKLKNMRPNARYVPPKDSYYRNSLRLPGSIRIKVGHF